MVCDRCPIYVSTHVSCWHAIYLTIEVLIVMAPHSYCPHLYNRWPSHLSRAMRAPIATGTTASSPRVRASLRASGARTPDKQYRHKRTWLHKPPAQAGQTTRLSIEVSSDKAPERRIHHQGNVNSIHFKAEAKPTGTEHSIKRLNGQSRKNQPPCPQHLNHLRPPLHTPLPLLLLNRIPGPEPRLDERWLLFLLDLVLELAGQLLHLLPGVGDFAFQRFAGHDGALLGYCGCE